MKSSQKLCQTGDELKAKYPSLNFEPIMVGAVLMGWRVEVNGHRMDGAYPALLDRRIAKKLGKETKEGDRPTA